MKRKIFDCGLYTEMFRQLRTIGIIVTALFMIISLGSIISEVSEARDRISRREEFEADLIYDEECGMYYSEEYDLYYDKENGVLKEYCIDTGEYYETHRYMFGIYDQSIRDYPPFLPMIFFAVPLVAFALAEKLMNLWFVKKSADFYGSLKYSRTEYYTSILTAVLTWTLIISVIPSLTSFGIASRYSEAFSIVWSKVPKRMMSIVPASLYGTGVAMMATSVTGTVLTSLAASAAIGLMPISITMYIGSNVSYTSSAAEICRKLIEINPVRSLLEYMDGDYTASWDKIIYTSCVGIVFLIIAWRLFVKRPAETAENSAVSRTVDDLIRMSLTAIVTLMIISERCDIINFVTWMCLLFICNCIYVLINEKKWKSIVRIIPQFIVLVIAACILYIPTL